MTEYALLNKRLDHNTDLIDLIESTNCKVENLGSGDTTFTVENMAEMVMQTLGHTERISKEFKRRYGNDVDQIHKALNDFLWKNYRYRMDGEFQDLRSPGCAKATRNLGIDCKSVTITASSILMNLGIPHAIRQVKKLYDQPDKFTHVYAVIFNDGKTLAVDGTTDIYEEQPFRQKDDYNMNHRGLHSPQTKDPKKAASASRHARMLKNGTTKAVRSIGGKGLAKYRQGLANPENLNELEKQVLASQVLFRLLVQKGANPELINTLNRDLRSLVESGKQVALRIRNTTAFLNGKAYALTSPGLKSFTLDTGNMFGSTGGFDTAGYGGASTGGGGFDLGSLFGGSASGDNSGIGSTGGSVAGMAVAGPLGASLGGLLGNFGENLLSGSLCIGTSGSAAMGKEDGELDGEFFLQASGIKSTVNEQTFNEFIWMAYNYVQVRQAKSTRSNLSKCTKEGNKIASEMIAELIIQVKQHVSKGYDIQQVGSRPDTGRDQIRLVSGFHDNKLPSGYGSWEVPVFRLTPKPQQTNPGGDEIVKPNPQNTNGNFQNSNNSNPSGAGNNNNGSGTSTLKVAGIGLGLAGAIFLGTTMLKKNDQSGKKMPAVNKKNTKSKKS